MENARTFTNRLADLLARERTALADFLVALAEFDRKRLWLDLGHASLFYFLHRELGLSKGAAYYRKTAAELIQRLPQIVEPLRDGRLCLTTVVEVSKVVTPENADEVLPRFFQLSKNAAKEVSAEICPAAAPRRDVVTVARAPSPAPAFALRSSSPDPGHAAVHPANQAPASQHAIAGRADDAVGAVRSANPLTGDDATPPAVALVPPSAPPRAAGSRPASVEPLTADLNRLHVTVSRRFLRKLEAARAALSQSHPGAGMEEILEAGLDLVLERHAKRRGLVKKPRTEPRPSKPGHVPAHVLRAVWKRDGGKCQWELRSGGVCGSTLRVEIDHRIAKARGGTPTIQNLRCLCRTHNVLAARQVFGDAFMDRYTRRGRAPLDAGVAAALPPA